MLAGILARLILIFICLIILSFIFNLLGSFGLWRLFLFTFSVVLLFLRLCEIFLGRGRMGLFLIRFLIRRGRILVASLSFLLGCCFFILILLFLAFNWLFTLDLLFFLAVG